VIDKPLSAITPADLQRLIDDQVGERKTLDYKRDLPGNARTDRIEFLADISSFANTEGGDLIFGIEAPSGGLPVKIPGLVIDNVESLKLAFESRIRDGISRRLPGVEIREIAIGDGLFVLIVRLPKSWIGPHRVILEGHGHFYGRNSAGKYRLDVEELQTAFTLGEALADRIRSFRADRVIAIKAGDTPLEIEEGPKIIVHLVPLSAFSGAARRDLGDVLGPFVQSNFLAYKPMGSPLQWGHSVNIDGRLIYIVTGSGAPAPRSYTQIFRTGIVEAVRHLRPVTRNGQTYILCREWTLELRAFLQSQFQMLGRLGLEPPLYLFLSLADAKGYFLADEFFQRISEAGLARSDILFPEVTVSSLGADIDALLIPLLNRIWNAAGDERCPHFDADGKWMGPPR
jgi:schlafen family protein